MLSLYEATNKLMSQRCLNAMSIKKRCYVLGISSKTGYLLLKSDDIATLRIGPTYRIPRLVVKENESILGTC